MFNQQELQNILTLINRAQISGQEAIGVAILQQKIASLLQPKENAEPGKTKNETKK
jgi:hypothetical protein